MLLLRTFAMDRAAGAGSIRDRTGSSFHCGRLSARFLPASAALCRVSRDSPLDGNPESHVLNLGNVVT